MENTQYRICLAITGAIQGFFRKKLYQEQGHEPLSDRRWYRKVLFLNKIVNKLLPLYLISYLNLKHEESCENTLKTLSNRTETFKNPFYPYCVRDWNKLNLTLKK